MAEKRFDVLVIGELNADIIFNKINKIPEIGKEQRADSLTVTQGSSSAIFASNLSKLGPEVCFSGKIGDDHFGKLVTDSLEENGVNTGFIIRDPSLQTGATVILGINSDRMMVTYPGAMEHFSLTDLNESIFSQAKHLHTSSVFFQPGIKKDLKDILKTARENGMTTSMDTQWDPEEKWNLDLRAILPFLDFFMPNENEFFHLTGTSELSDAFQKLTDFETTFIVKKGLKGAVWKKGNHRFDVPAFHVPDFVDAIGAGDSFNAGFIRAFLNEKEPKDCMLEATRTAAASTMAAGGTSGIQNFEQVTNVTRNFKPAASSYQNEY